MYSIDELEENFRLHHGISVELKKKLLKQFQENNPGEPIPDPFNEEFSLPLALAAICVAIRDLREFTKKK